MSVRRAFTIQGGYKMYAIIAVGGKQYSVKPGDVIEVEKQEVEAGKEIVLKDVLLVSNEGDLKIGQPLVKGASVKADVLEQTKGIKVVSFKYRRRKSSHWKKGHRQKLTKLEIKEIVC